MDLAQRLRVPIAAFIGQVLLTILYSRFSSSNGVLNTQCTNDIIVQVAWRLGRYMAAYSDDVSPQDIMVPQSSQQHGGESVCTCSLAQYCGNIFAAIVEVEHI